MSRDDPFWTEETEADLGPVVTARFDSECGICDQEILEGQDIRSIDSTWAHAHCAEGVA